MKLSEISLAIIALSGGYQIYKDNQQVDQLNKNYIIERDLIILGSTVAGAAIGGEISEKLLKTKKMHEIFKECVANFTIAVGGIITGIISGEIAEKLLPFKQNPKVKSSRR